MKRFNEFFFEPAAHRKMLSGQLIWFLLWLAVTVIGVLLLKPSPFGHGTHTQLGLPPCPSVVLFDRPCPGCGLTTSWTAFMHGRVFDSFRVHPIGPVLYLGFSFSALLAGYGFWKMLRLRTEGKEINRFLTVVLVGFLVFGVVRFSFFPLKSPMSLAYWSQQSQQSSGEKGGESAGVPEDGGSGEATGTGKVE